MISAIEFSPQQPHLTEFSAYLQRLQFPHRLSEHEGRIVLWVYQEEHVAIANELYERFRLMPEYALHNAKTQVRSSKLSSVSSPVSLSLILACVAGFLVVTLHALEWLSLFSLQGFDLVGEALQVHDPELVRQKIIGGELWRLFTPVFLHFDIMHLTFNATILWFLGSQIEKKEGSIRFLMYVLVMGVVSNMTQYYYSADHLFGGMSGVNYGLLGYCGLLNYRHKLPVYFLPSGFFIVSVIMMLLGFLNVFSLFGYAIANWAHLAGFVAGLLLAMLAGNRQKKFV